MLSLDQNREQAAKARRLCTTLSDGEAVVALMKYAQECDEAAEAAEMAQLEDPATRA